MYLNSRCQKLTGNSYKYEKLFKEKDVMIQALNEDVNELMESLEEQTLTINLYQNSTRYLHAQKKENDQEVDKLTVENHEIIEENVQLLKNLKKETLIVKKKSP